MLHTANINLVELSSRALQIPLVSGETKGNKEEELLDIKHAVLLCERKIFIRHTWLRRAREQLPEDKN